MIEKFKVVGFSHHTSSIEVRELLSFHENENRSFIVRMKEVLGVEEAMLVSTCNRTEFYYSAEEELTEEVISLVKVFKALDTDVDLHSYFRSLQGKDAIEHLYEVAMGLDARVLGDIQISNQIKRAYQASADEDLAGPFLHRTMHSVFFANKRVVQETAFRDGAASTSYASVDITQHFIGNFSNPKVLVLGLGEIGKDVAENLVDVNASVTLCTRNIEKAREMAANLGFDAVSYSDALQQLYGYDVVISSLAVSQPVINASAFHPRGLVQKLFIDLSVPRSIDPDIEQIPGFLLYNIDQIEEKTSSIQEKRKAAIPQVREIMNQSISELDNWAQDMEVSPTIKKLKAALDTIRQEELARYVNKASEQELHFLDKASKNIIQKVIKLPVLQLKAACKRGEADQLVDVLTDLFDLEKVQEESGKS